MFGRRQGSIVAPRRPRTRKQCAPCVSLHGASSNFAKQVGELPKAFGTWTHNVLELIVGTPDLFRRARSASNFVSWWSLEPNGGPACVSVPASSGRTRRASDPRDRTVPAGSRCGRSLSGLRADADRAARHRVARRARQASRRRCVERRIDLVGMVRACDRGEQSHGPDRRAPPHARKRAGRRGLDRDHAAARLSLRRSRRRDRAHILFEIPRARFGARGA
jgi:hypothetical protein